MKANCSIQQCTSSKEPGAHVQHSDICTYYRSHRTFFRKLSFWMKYCSIIIDTVDHITSFPTTIIQFVIAGKPGSGHSSNKEVILLMGYSVQLYYHVLMDLKRLQSSKEISPIVN